MTTPQAKKSADAVRKSIQELMDIVPGKAEAYGDAHSIQRELWRALLRQYIVWTPDGTELYQIPVAMMDHVPRLTRVFDRVCRIVANPANDLGGEDPWRDMAGDAVAGMVMPRTPPPVATEGPPTWPGRCHSHHPSRPIVRCGLMKGHPGEHEGFDPNRGEHEAWGGRGAEACGVRARGGGQGCELEAGHLGPHRYVHAGGVAEYRDGEPPQPPGPERPEVSVGFDEWAPGHN